MSLPMALGLTWMIFDGPFQAKPYDPGFRSARLMMGWDMSPHRELECYGFIPLVPPGCTLGRQEWTTVLAIRSRALWLLQGQALQPGWSRAGTQGTCPGPELWECLPLLLSLKPSHWSKNKLAVLEHTEITRQQQLHWASAGPAVGKSGFYEARSLQWMTSWPWCPSITQSNVFANRNIYLDSQWFNKLFFLHRVYWFLLLVRAKDCIVRVGVLQCFHPFLMYTLLYFPLYDFHHPLLPQICFLSSLCPEASHFLFTHSLINVFISSGFLNCGVVALEGTFLRKPLGFVFAFFCNCN